jgi:hypothetical protein
MKIISFSFLIFLFLFSVVFADCTDYVGSPSNDLYNWQNSNFNPPNNTSAACTGVSFITSLAMYPYAYENWPNGYRCGAAFDFGGYFRLVDKNPSMPSGSEVCAFHYPHNYPLCGASGIGNEKAIVEVENVFSLVISSPSLGSYGYWACQMRWTFFDGTGHAPGDTPNVACTTRCCASGCSLDMYSQDCACSRFYGSGECGNSCSCLDCPQGKTMNYFSCSCICALTTDDCPAPNILDAAACTCTPCSWTAQNCLAPYVLRKGDGVCECKLRSVDTAGFGIKRDPDFKKSGMVKKRVVGGYTVTK